MKRRMRDPYEISCTVITSAHDHTGSTCSKTSGTVHRKDELIIQNVSSRVRLYTQYTPSWRRKPSSSVHAVLDDDGSDHGEMKSQEEHCTGAALRTRAPHAQRTHAHGVSRTRTA